MQRAMLDSIAEIGRVCEAERIDADYSMVGAIMAATSSAQSDRLRRSVDELHSFGFGEDEFRLLSATETDERVRAQGVFCSLLIPHAAALHPAKLTRGLARACENRGVTIRERTAVIAVGNRFATTEHGRVRAEVVVRATEAYTGSLRRHDRLLAPIEDAMIATEPLPASFWHEYWSGREVFADTPHMFVYAQRTADDRIAIGGMRIRYHYGARTPDPSSLEAEWKGIRGRLVELFPATQGAQITHRWGGYLGLPRNYRPSVGFQRGLGVAWAGGYVGDGNPNTNLAGRTLRDLILERDGELTGLPWVGQRWHRWEPEPLAWLGINAVTELLAAADRSETRTGGASRLGNLAKRVGLE